jgi:hypothetical protein
LNLTWGLPNEILTKFDVICFPASNSVANDPSSLPVTGKKILRSVFWWTFIEFQLQQMSAWDAFAKLLQTATELQSAQEKFAVLSESRGHTGLMLARKP